jgi:hypothetical protein
MAVVMSEMPDVWRKVLAEHVPDGQYCRACFHDGGRASWPCQTYRIAQEAKWVAEGGLPGTGPHGPGPSRTRLSPPEPEPHLAGRGHGDGLPSASPDASPGAYPSTGGHPATDYAATAERAYPTSGGWAVPAGPAAPEYEDRPFAGDPLSSAVTGERPYGSTFDAPYGASFGVDDRPHATRW